MLMEPAAAAAAISHPHTVPAVAAAVEDAAAVHADRATINPLDKQRANLRFEDWLFFVCVG